MSDQERAYIEEDGVEIPLLLLCGCGRRLPAGEEAIWDLAYSDELGEDALFVTACRLCAPDLFESSVEGET